MPISIDAFSGELLEAAGIQNLQGLADLAPSLTILGQNGWTGALDVRLRGQGGTAFNRDPGVGLYINEAYVSEATSVMSSFVDVEQGRNAKRAEGHAVGACHAGRRDEYRAQGTGEPNLKAKPTPHSGIMAPGA